MSTAALRQLPQGRRQVAARSAALIFNAFGANRPKAKPIVLGEKFAADARECAKTHRVSLAEAQIRMAREGGQWAAPSQQSPRVDETRHGSVAGPRRDLAVLAGLAISTMLALCHVPTRAVIWRWIDDELVEELTRRDPAWIGQETISIPLASSNTLEPTTLRAVESRVLTFRRTARRVLAPGSYYQAQARLSQTADLLLGYAKKAEFQSVAKRLADLTEALRASTYVVALTGPTRAGKSTLLNALLGRDVSPVGQAIVTDSRVVLHLQPSLQEGCTANPRSIEIPINHISSVSEGTEQIGCASGTAVGIRSGTATEVVKAKKGTGVEGLVQVLRALIRARHGQ